ncbi:MAG: hypothetical protein ABH871_02190 [Pseudomonadota bacterium]
MSTRPNTAIFKSIADRDCFNLFDGPHPKAKEVLKILNYDRKDLSVVTGKPEKSIRLDQRMSEEIETRIREWANVINLVGGYFGDINKTMLWFQTPNPLLGNITPAQMIKVGQFNKLLSFIQVALSENRKSA